ncbi:hypothetical protein COCON_G00121710 [Conger conger]|uniref:Uncharacterized protein n=1 Tax=Conger conger TaxID=82655 RepID=A0A9Q1DGX0_CONCO|nr:hypothetical protein COCON_G00121710 [Conger conger]
MEGFLPESALESSVQIRKRREKTRKKRPKSFFGDAASVIEKYPPPSPQARRCVGLQGTERAEKREVSPNLALSGVPRFTPFVLRCRDVAVSLLSPSNIHPEGRTAADVRKSFSYTRRGAKMRRRKRDMRHTVYADGTGGIGEIAVRVMSWRGEVAL